MGSEVQIRFYYGLLIVLVGMSLYTDLKINKIKNITTYPFMLLGLIINLITDGWRGGLHSFYGISTAIGLLFIFYLIGAMGAGDLKLFAAIGALMGKAFVMKVMALSFMSGGMIALILMIIRRNGRARLRYLINYITLSLMTGSLSIYSQSHNYQKDKYTMPNQEKAKFPFAIAIFSGVMIMILLKPL